MFPQDLWVSPEADRANHSRAYTGWGRTELRVARSSSPVVPAVDDKICGFPPKPIELTIQGRILAGPGLNSCLSQKTEMSARQGFKANQSLRTWEASTGRAMKAYRNLEELDLGIICP